MEKGGGQGAGGGVQEAGEVANGRQEGEGERGRTGSCESCKNLGHPNSTTYSLSASSLGTLNGAMEGRRGSRSPKVLLFGGFSSYVGTSAFCHGLFSMPRRIRGICPLRRDSLASP